jgi:hypothetical protein
MKAPSVREGSKERTLKLLGTEFIKDTWFANLSFQTWQTQRAIANIPGSGLGDGNLLCGVGVVYLYPYSLESYLHSDDSDHCQTTRVIFDLL